MGDCTETAATRIKGKKVKQFEDVGCLQMQNSQESRRLSTDSQ